MSNTWLCKRLRTSREEAGRQLNRHIQRLINTVGLTYHENTSYNPIMKSLSHTQIETENMEAVNNVSHAEPE